MRKMLDKCVDEHVAGAGVEGKNLIGSRASRDDRDISDSADIQRNAPEFRMAVEKIVHVRNERRALAAERHVRRTKITDRCNASARGDNGPFANLKSGSSWLAEI